MATTGEQLPVPIPRDIPEEVVGRCLKNYYPPFVKFYYNAEHKEEDMYIEFAELPQDLLPGIEKILPFNFQEEAWKKNLTMAPEEPDPETGEKRLSLLDQIPFHYKDFFISPHVVYPGVFFMLLNAHKIEGIKKPFDDLAEVKNVSFRGVANVYEMYRLYRCVLFWFEGHFMMEKSQRWKARTEEVLKRHGERIMTAGKMFRASLMFLPERRDITRKVSHGEGKMLDYYSDDLADRIAQKSFDYCVSILHILELALMELMQFKIEKCVEAKFLTSTVRPEVSTVSPVVKDQVLQDLIAFSVEICNNSIEDDDYHYKVDHMNLYPTSPKWILSPSFFYQTFFFAVIGDALPKSKEIDEKDKAKGTKPNGHAATP